MEGRSIGEIADLLGLELKTVYSRVHLAREHLKTFEFA
ncbi:sigma factor-like helix-turn-helix DNA-binding protein [Polyangium jinanense]